MMTYSIIYFTAYGVVVYFRRGAEAGWKHGIPRLWMRRRNVKLINVTRSIRTAQAT